MGRIVDPAWDAVERVAGEWDGCAVGVADEIGFFLIILIHFVGVAVVGGDDGDAADGADFFEESAECEVDGFDGDDGGFEVAGVSDHVAVGVVDADEIVVVCVECFDDGVGDFGAFHPGAL